MLQASVMTSGENKFPVSYQKSGFKSFLISFGQLIMMICFHFRACVKNGP